MKWFRSILEPESTGMPNPLTEQTFAEFVRAHRFVVIQFWAAWDRNLDQQMRRLLDLEVPAELREQIAFASVDVDAAVHYRLCREHGVINIPFLALYRDGSLVETVMGLRR